MRSLSLLPAGQTMQACCRAARSLTTPRPRDGDEGGVEALSEALLERSVALLGPTELAPVLTRFKNQLNENSGRFARVGVVPEMNHNEVVAWGGTGDVADPTVADQAVLLTWRGLQPEVRSASGGWSSTSKRKRRGNSQERAKAARSHAVPLHCDGLDFGDLGGSRRQRPDEHRAHFIAEGSSVGAQLTGQYNGPTTNADLGGVQARPYDLLASPRHPCRCHPAHPRPTEGAHAANRRFRADRRDARSPRLLTRCLRPSNAPNQHERDVREGPKDVACFRPKGGAHRLEARRHAPSRRLTHSLHRLPRSRPHGCARRRRRAQVCLQDRRGPVRCARCACRRTEGAVHPGRTHRSVRP